MQFLKKFKTYRLLALFACLLLSLTGCGTTEQGATNDPAKTGTPQLSITAADQNTDYSQDNVQDVILDQQSGLCTIEHGGVYRLTGSLTGQLKINAEDQIVYLILDNAEIKSTQGPALYVLSAGKVIVTLAEGSTNTLLDSGAYDPADEADACIYSTCDLTINGNGSLNVHGYYDDAVHSKDILKVLGGSLFIQSKRDGLRGNDGILLSCEKAEIQSERNGLRTTKTGKIGKGNIEIISGNYSIIGGKYAIECAQDLHIKNSTLHLIGVIGTMDVKGKQYVEKGCLSNG